MAEPTVITRTMPSLLTILENQPIRTWFGVGGKAKRMAIPRSLAELRACLKLDPAAKILGDGANLLVCDRGVNELVIALSDLNKGELAAFEIGSVRPDGFATVQAGAAAHLFKLINVTTDLGLSGLENLAGIPACIGGATVMNAGGKFGSFGDYVVSVEAMDRAGEMHTLPYAECKFNYRHSHFCDADLIITAVTLRLVGDDIATVKKKLKLVTDYKRSTQPMAASSAGCAFKNPTLITAIAGVADAGQRISAGMLIDKAGCKGLRLGTAQVSEQHGNFITADKGGSADDVLAIMRLVRRRVAEMFSVTLEPEVVVWGATL